MKELLATYRIKDVPVSAERIAKAKGAGIFHQSLEDNVSGFLHCDNPQAVIDVNTHHAAVRQNFTMAHEPGHYLLHDQEQLHYILIKFRVRLRDDVSSQGTGDAEREANFFAASLLMPKRFLEKDLESEEFVVR